jgi:hypothetical protein
LLRQRKVQTNESEQENPEASKPIVLGVIHSKQRRGQHDGSDRPKEGFGPPAKHDASEDKFLHDGRGQATANQHHEQAAGGSTDNKRRTGRWLVGQKRDLCRDPSGCHRESE